jgi:hypothetical protein
MTSSYRTVAELPLPFKQLLTLDVDYDEAGIDFEPYKDFLPAADAEALFRAWTDNANADGSPYLVFGQDGTGGYAAIWRAVPGGPLLDQPIVFFGGEGELAMVAATAWEFMWLLANGVGPAEVTRGRLAGWTCKPFLELAMEHSPGRRKNPAEVVLRANALYPDFVSTVRALTA